MGNGCYHLAPLKAAARPAQTRLSRQARRQAKRNRLRRAQHGNSPGQALAGSPINARSRRAFIKRCIPSDVEQSRHLTFSTAHIRGMHEPSQVSPGIDLRDQQPARHSTHVRWLVSRGRAARVWPRSSRSRPSSLLSDCRRLAVSRAWMEAAADRRNTFDARHFRFRTKRAAWIQARRPSHANHLRSALAWAPHVHGPAGYAGSLWTAQSDVWIAGFITQPQDAIRERQPSASRPSARRALTANRATSARTPSQPCRSTLRRSPCRR